MGPNAAAPNSSVSVLEKQIPSDVRKILASWDFTRRQLAALWHLAQFLLYGGAKGGGKTVFLCRWAVMECARFFGNKVFLGRQRSVDFKNTTLETFKRFINPNLYKLNKADQKIYLPWCNGQIDYGGLDDDDVVQKFNSAEYGAVGIDQGEETDRDKFGMLVGTLRHVLPDGRFPSYQVRITANPAECYLKTDFIEQPKQGDEKTGKGTYAFIKALHTDNPFLPPDYVSNLREALKHRPQLLKAYIEGIWDGLAALDILIQPSWVEGAKLLLPRGRAIKRVTVCDPAREGDDENVTFVMEMTDAGMCHLLPKFTHIEGYTPNTMDTARRLIKTRRDSKSNLIVVDATGIGAGIADYISETKREDDKNLFEPVFRYKGGENNEDVMPEPFKKKYANLKSWAWHAAADAFRDRLCCIPQNMPVLAGQLQWQRSVLVHEIIQRVLTKRELKEKRKQSPDQAEAYIMGRHGLTLAQELPDDQPISPAKEFWERVKADQNRIENPDDEGEWHKV